VAENADKSGKKLAHRETSGFDEPHSLSEKRKSETNSIFQPIRQKPEMVNAYKKSMFKICRHGKILGS
jgi:hypothetical protein